MRYVAKRASGRHRCTLKQFRLCTCSPIWCFVGEALWLHTSNLQSDLTGGAHNGIRAYNLARHILVFFQVHAAGMKAGVALKPQTHAELLLPYLQQGLLDMVGRQGCSLAAGTAYFRLAATLHH